MANGQDKLKRYQDMYDKYSETMDTSIDSIGRTTQDEMQTIQRLNQARMRDASKGVERDTWGEFRAQVGRGFLESATMAPTLWEQLGGIDVPGAIKSVEGEYAWDEWDELGEKGKIGYGLGTAAGALAPWGLAGWGLKATIGGVGRLTNAAVKNPWTRRAALREVKKRASQLSGKSAIKMSDEVLEQTVDTARDAVGKTGFASVLGLKAGAEGFEYYAKGQMKEMLTKEVGEKAVDDVVDIAYDAGTSMRPKDAHAFLSNTIGRIASAGRGMKGRPNRLAGEIAAAYSYDAMLGATIGYARYNMQNWSKFQEKTEQEGWGTWWDYRRERGYKDMVSEMMHEAAWIGFLGPVRLIKGGTASTLRGKAGRLTMNTLRANLRPINRMTAKEARAQLKFIDKISEGALKLEGIPVISKAASKFKKQAKVDKRELHWSDMLEDNEPFEALKAVRWAFTKKAPKFFAQEFGKDMFGSMPRMLAGATAMNLPAISQLYEETGGDIATTLWNTPYTWGETMPEIMANMMVGMAMTKRGRGMRIYDKPTTQSWLQRGNPVQFIGGQASVLRKVMASMEKMGLTTKQIRRDPGLSVYDWENNTRYMKETQRFAFDGDKTYAEVMRIIKEREINPDKLKDMKLKEGELPYQAALQSILDKESNPKIRKEIQSQASVADRIIGHMQKHSQHRFVLGAMTPEQALSFVRSISSAKINGEVSSVETINQNLARHDARVFGNATREAVKIQQEYVRKILKDLGLDVDLRTDSLGRIILPGALKLETARGTSGEASNMMDNLRNILETGDSMGWLKFGDKSIERYVPSSEQVGKALETHNTISMKMHKRVYGDEYARGHENFRGLWDDSIMSARTWSVTAREYQNIRQTDGALSILTGNVSHNDVTGGMDSQRILENLQRVMGARNIEVVGWDKVKDADYATAESRSEVSKWFDNLKQAYNLLNESPVSPSQKVQATKLIELKQKMDSLVGDVFVHGDAFRALMKGATEYGVRNIGLEGQAHSSAAGIMRLIGDRAISDGNDLPTVDKMFEYLKMKEGTGEITKDERVELENYYKDNIVGAIKESKTQVIDIKDKDIDESAQEGWLFALRKSRESFKLEEQRSDALNVKDLIEKIDLLEMSVNEKSLLAEGGVPLEGKKPEGKQPLMDYLTSQHTLLTDLRYRIERAIREGDVGLIKELSRRHPDLSKLLNEMASVTPSSSHEAYLADLTRHLSKMQAFEDQRIHERQMDVINERRIADSKIEGSREGLHEPSMTITPAEFAMKYNINPNIMMDIIKTTKNRIKSVEKLFSDLQNTMPRIFNQPMDSLKPSERNLVESMNQWITDIRSLDASVDIKPTARELARELVPRIMLMAKVQTDVRHGLGVIKNKADLDHEVKTDTYQLLKGIVGSKEVNILEFRNGTFDLNKSVVANNPKHGFLGIQESLLLHDNLYLMSNKATVDGKRAGMLTKDVVSQIVKTLNERDIGITSLEYMRMRATNTDSDLLGDFASLYNREGKFHMIHLDENTNMVLLINQAARQRISWAYVKGSENYAKIDEMFDLDSNRNLKQSIDRISEGAAAGDIKALERGILLSRLVNDFPTDVARHLTGEPLKLKDMKALWKRLNLTEPKSGIFGTQESRDFALESYRIFSGESADGLHARVLDVMTREFETPYRALVINDESVTLPGDRNPLDAKQVAKSRARALQNEGLLTREQVRAIDADADNIGGRSVVDAEFYLSKNRFLAALGFHGIKREMLNFDNNGDISGFKTGAIKPTIHKANTNADGSMEVVIGKTAFKYNPDFEQFMSDREINSISFKSSIKKWDTVGARVDGTNQQVNRNNWQRIEGQDRDGVASRGWEEVVQSLPADRVVEIPWENINFKQVAREHTSGIGANTFNYFGNKAQASASQWADVEFRMDRFATNYREMLADPHASTAMLRQMMQFSVETGDNTLARTGLDYAVGEGHVLVDSWMIPQIEKSMISFYLNGGSIAHRDIYNSSMDIMTAAPNEYDMPVRLKVNEIFGQGGEPIQTRFGGKGISAFLGDKVISLTGQSNTVQGQNIQAREGSAFIFRHKFLSKTGKGDAKIEQSSMEEGLVYQLSNGDVVINYRGLEVRQDGSVRKLSESDRSDWDVIKHESLKYQDEAFTKEFFIDMWRQHAGEGSAYANAVKFAETVPGMTTSMMVKKLEMMGGDNQNLWMAAFSLRQPRNSAGDIVITKIQEVLNRNMGNIEKTNLLDALKHHDADFDFDKNSTFTSAPDLIWREIAKHSGSKVWSNEADIVRAVEHLMNRDLRLDDNGMMRNTQGDVIEGAMIRGRFVKMHQTMTYLQNMFTDGGTIMSMKKGTQEFDVKWNDDPSVFLNRSEAISHWVKAYIDLYDPTPRSQINSREFIENIQWDIFFGKGKFPGLFKIIEKNGNEHSIQDNKFVDIKQAMQTRIFSPLNKFLTYNRGTADLGEGYSRQASLEQMSHGYSAMIGSFSKYGDNVMKTQSWDNIDLNPGFYSIRNHFNKSLNPFDYGMRRLHELDREKYADIDYKQNDIGRLLESIEMNKYENLSTAETEWNGQLQKVFHEYIKAEPKMVELVGLQRKIDGLRENMEFKRDRFGETYDVKREELQIDRMEQLRDEIVAGIGMSNDYIQKNYSETINTIPNKKKGYAKGKFVNSTKVPVGIIVKGNLSEVILPGNRNKSNIPGKNLATIIEQPRRYEIQSKSSLGDRINMYMFADSPKYYHENGTSVSLDKGTWRGTEPLIPALKARFANIYKEFADRPNETIATREALLVDAIHRELSQWRNFANNYGELGQWSLIQRILVPEVDKSVMVISPQVGLDQSVNVSPKVEMYKGGRLEKYLVSYLNQVRQGKYNDTIDGTSQSVFTAEQAGKMLNNMYKAKTIGLFEMTHKFGNMDVVAEGFFNKDVDLSQYHGFKRVELNHEVSAWANDMNMATADAAKTLMKYASGETLIDPFVLYRSAYQMRKVGIPESQVFGKWINVESDNNYGKTSRFEFLHPMDAKSQRGRKFGDQSQVSEGVEGLIDRKFKCGGR